eukprot:137806_1
MSTVLIFTLCLILNAYGFFPVTYETGDSIPVRVSNVAPFHNPTEKYEYDYLPWPCKPRRKRAHLDNFRLGSMFNGERNRKSLYEIKFNSSMSYNSVCGETSLDEHAVNAFIDAITNEYQYEMWVDDIPVFGRIGFWQTSDQIAHGKMYFVITHRHFYVRYNAKNQIISVNISSVLRATDYVEIQKDLALSKVHFTYSVSHSFIDAEYWRRFEFMRSGSESSSQVEVHWLWILNSCFLVILLAGLLSMVLLRTVKNDYAHYLALEDEGDEMEDAAGWKRIRFDVFRAPHRGYLFASIVGVGCQLLLISFVLLVLAGVGYFYCGNHGRIYVAAVFGYSLTAYCAGYVASAKAKDFIIIMQREAEEEYDWARSCGYTLALFAVPYLVMFSVVNSIAIYYESAVALPAETILSILFLWAFVTFPLTAFGAFRGAKSAEEEYPCHVKRANQLAQSSQESDLPWYYNRYLLCFMVGFLQFMSIYVELHTIFNSVWGHQPYTLFGILFLTFCILLIVTSCLVILTTYFELNVENYKWWWPSLMRGGACGAFISV